MLRIDSPFHGAALNHRHGEETAEGLALEATGRAPLGVEVTVNGVAAERAGGAFSARVLLTERESDIAAVCASSLGTLEHRVRVVWDRASRPRYRFAIDDNSFFLRDVATRRYDSLFDCFYLDMLRRLHEKYATKFVLNCYYTTGEDFSLPDFPDDYRGEWRDNADWLKLSFHAYADKPDRPYQYASPEELAHDYDLVAAEIARFAGEETWSPPTVIHWGMVQPAALATLAERGVRVLSGLFGFRNGVYDVNYFLDDERSEYLSRHGALMDFESGIVFSRVCFIANKTPAENVAPLLESLIADPNTAEVMDLFTHEQYFWPFYGAYIRDHAERLETAIRFVTERGYEPVWFHEGFLGGEE